MRVWILTVGERSDWTNIIGVYASKEAAYDDFVHHAGLITRGTYVFDRAEVLSDEGVYVSSGCDEVHLDPHDLRTAPINPQSAIGGVHKELPRG
jgi:hypothetical protein